MTSTSLCVWRHAHDQFPSNPGMSIAKIATSCLTLTVSVSDVSRIGGAKVLMAGVVLWSLGTLVAPPAAKISLLALCASRVFVSAAPHSAVSEPGCVSCEGYGRSGLQRRCAALNSFLKCAGRAGRGSGALISNKHHGKACARVSIFSDAKVFIELHVMLTGWVMGCGPCTLVHASFANREARKLISLVSLLLLDFSARAHAGLLM